MPGLDGYETARLIRQREQSKRTPIIFLTAINKEDAHMLRGYDAGAVDYVFKPFDPIMLRSKVTVFVELFEKTREIQQKAALEQSLLQQALQANAERLEAERALRKAQEREEAILRSLPVCFHARASTPPFARAFRQRGGGTADRLCAGALYGGCRFRAEPHPSRRSACRDGGARQRPRGGRLFLRVPLALRRRQLSHLPRPGRHLRAMPRAVRPKSSARCSTSRSGGSSKDRLMQSQRLDAIGKLTGGLAHDFNNLLASILSGLGLLERRAKLDGDARQIVDMTRHAARHGAELVNRMLAFSRRQNLQPTAVRLTTLADTMNGLVAPILGGLVRFDWQVDGSVWPAHVDAGQLELAADEPGLQRARRHAVGRHRLDPRRQPHRAGRAPTTCRPATMSASR